MMNGHATSKPPKVLQTAGALYILTWTRTSCHSGVQFFDILTSKSSPGLPRSIQQKKRKIVRAWCVLCILTWKFASRHKYHVSTSKLPKVVRPWCVLCILTWKRTSRHSGVHCFDILTLKSRPKLVCFVRFDLETRFVPQRCAVFRHPNFKKSSMFALTTWLRRTHRFSETFPSSRTRNHWKNIVICGPGFLTFRPTVSSFF